LSYKKFSDSKIWRHKTYEEDQAEGLVYCGLDLN